MKLFARRTPISWGAITFGLLFAALFTHAATTGDAFVPGGRGTPSKHILHASDPQEFAFWLRLYGAFAIVGVAVAFARVVPIEDIWRAFRVRTKAAVQEKGYDSTPAPKWAYVFLVGFLGLIVWIGWKTMYSE